MCREYHSLSDKLLDTQIESSVLSSGVLSCDENGNPLIDDHLIDRILQGIWAELSYLPETVTLPSILTSQGSRLALQGIILGELPQMAVVSYQELPPDLNIQPVARIKLSK